MIDLKDIPFKDIVKALRKVKGIQCYVIEDKYILEVPKESELNGTKAN